MHFEIDAALLLKHFSQNILLQSFPCLAVQEAVVFIRFSSFPTINKRLPFFLTS
jgi:hypothetical protein